MNKVYFPNLNGLRFIAAFLVVLHHLAQFNDILGLNTTLSIPFVNIVGKLGVVLFFVLSGFLITYLLLAEEEHTGSISVKNFYIRRVLRIWPLYYTLIFLGFFVFPHIDFLHVNLQGSDLTPVGISTNFFLYLFFLPNLANVLYGPVMYISQTWSIGVEEQFYLLWPVLMKKIKNRYLLLFGVIFLYLFTKFYGLHLIDMVLWKFGLIDISKTVLATAVKFLYFFNIDCMAIGGIFAVMLYQKHKMLDWLYNKYLQVAVLAVLIVMLAFGVTVPYVHYEVYSIFFGYLILNLAANKNSIINMEYRVFDYLGKISYGLYMFHIIGIVVALKLLNMVGIQNVAIQLLLAMGFTIALSAVSYEYLEKFFIKRKLLFSSILSGDNIHKKIEK